MMIRQWWPRGWRGWLGAGVMLGPLAVLLVLYQFVVPPPTPQQIAFDVRLWWQTEVLRRQQFPLTAVAPFAWGQACYILTMPYRVDHGEINKAVNRSNFDADTLHLSYKDMGGYMIFIDKMQAVPVWWDEFSSWTQRVSPEASPFSGCWDQNTIIRKDVNYYGIISYRIVN